MLEWPQRDFMPERSAGTLPCQCWESGYRALAPRGRRLPSSLCCALLCRSRHRSSRHAGDPGHSAAGPARGLAPSLTGWPGASAVGQLLSFPPEVALAFLPKCP